MLKNMVVKFLLIVGMSFLVLVPIMYALYKEEIIYAEDTCSSVLGNNITDTIASYQTIVNKIVNVVLNGDFNNFTWNQLSIFIDTFGNRIVGTARLEKAIDYMLNLSASFDLENVHGENVSVPYWIRFVVQFIIFESFRVYLKFCFTFPLTQNAPHKAIHHVLNNTFSIKNYVRVIV